MTTVPGPTGMQCPTRPVFPTSVSPQLKTPAYALNLSLLTWSHTDLKVPPLQIWSASIGMKFSRRLPVHSSWGWAVILIHRTSALLPLPSWHTVAATVNPVAPLMQFLTKPTGLLGSEVSQQQTCTSVSGSKVTVEPCGQEPTVLVHQ